VAGVVGSRHADVQERQRADGDRDATLSALGQLRAGREGGKDERDQRNDDAKPGDEREQCGGVVGEMDEAVKDAWWQPAEVRPNADVGQPATPSPATPAITVDGLGLAGARP